MVLDTDPVEVGWSLAWRGLAETSLDCQHCRRRLAENTGSTQGNRTQALSRGRFGIDESRRCASGKRDRSRRGRFGCSFTTWTSSTQRYRECIPDATKARCGLLDCETHPQFNRKQIVELAVKLRLRRYTREEYVEAGGLMTYGTNYNDCSGAPPPMSTKS